MEGDDDRRLQMIGQQGLEAERAHALDQDAAVVAVAGAAAGDAALLRMLAQRLLEGDDHLDRRGEAPLRSLLHRRPLVVQVEAERMGVALGRLERGTAGNDEADSGYALDAFVRGGGDGVEGD